MKNVFLAFGEKSFLLLWVGEVFTQVAFNLFNFFIILHVYELTKSNTAVSMAVLSFTIPAILFGILAGVYVDWWNKKKVLLVTNILRAILLIILANFSQNIFLVYITSFLISVVTQFFIPAETPMIPLVVRPQYLLSANALFGLGLYGSILVAYIISGPIILFLGAENIPLFLSVLFLLGALFISWIHFHPEEKNNKKNVFSESRKTIINEIKIAFSQIKNSRKISHAIFLLALAQILLLVLAVIAPGYASQVVKIPIEQFPIYFIAPAAFGVFMGAVILVNYFSHFSKDKIMTGGLFLSGFAMFLLPYGSAFSSKQIVQSINVFLPRLFEVTTLHILILLAFILGLANSFVFVPSNTVLQEETSDEFRGKLYGVLNAFVGVLSFFPIIVVGGLSDLIGVDKVIIGIGIILLSIGVSRILFEY
jgi:MFS family permease